MRPTFTSVKLRKRKKSKVTREQGQTPYEIGRKMRKEKRENEAKKGPKMAPKLGEKWK